MNYFGIDPGQSGGVALITTLFTRVWVMPMRGKEVDGRELVEMLTSVKQATVLIEKVNAMPGQGVTSMFNFGMGFGKVKGVVEALGMSYHLVTPQAWKKKVLEGMDWKGKKSASVEYCARAYPEISLLRTPRCKKPHDGLSDALCIAEYGRLTR